MWLRNSSVGRKVVMSLTGIALVLFLTFHGAMNVVALVGAEYYNAICEFLGSHWYAVAATVILAAMVGIHFIYAIWLTLQNKKARGNNAYAVKSRPDKVEWASQNMFVLGFIVVLGLLLHLYNFWYHMMGTELMGIEKFEAHAADGYYWIATIFSCKLYAALYIVWLIALWYHLTHGIWSAMQTLGLSGKVWFKRWKKVSNLWSTFVVLMFMAVVVAFATGMVGCCQGCPNGGDEQGAATCLCDDCQCTDCQCAGECTEQCTEQCGEQCGECAQQCGEHACAAGACAGEHQGCEGDSTVVCPNACDTVAVEHNHHDRSIHAEGECPACDAQREATEE